MDSIPHHGVLLSSRPVTRHCVHRNRDDGESRELLPIAKARTTHSPLKAMASEIDTDPTGWEAANATGLKVKAGKSPSGSFRTLLGQFTRVLQDAQQIWAGGAGLKLAQQFEDPENPAVRTLLKHGEERTIRFPNSSSGATQTATRVLGSHDRLRS